MSENLAIIEEFPEYFISDRGRVIKASNYREMRLSYTKRGNAKVGLVKDGCQHARSVPRLVAEAFVEGQTDLYNTPMLLDNNYRNNRADNIVWRQRWFSMAYRRQFTEPQLQGKMGPVLDVDTGQIYPTILDVCTTNGLLIVPTATKAFNKERTYPTGQLFVLCK